LHVSVRKSERGRGEVKKYKHRKSGRKKRTEERIKKIRERLVHLFFSHYDQYRAIVELRRMNKHGILDKFIYLLERLVANEVEYPAKLPGRRRHHMINRTNGGSNHRDNKVLLYIHREQILHLLFDDKNQYVILRELRGMNEDGSFTPYIRRFARLIQAKRNQRPSLWWDKKDTTKATEAIAS
jgi:hypothetical protein